MWLYPFIVALCSLGTEAGPLTKVRPGTSYHADMGDNSGAVRYTQINYAPSRRMYRAATSPPRLPELRVEAMIEITVVRDGVIQISL